MRAYITATSAISAQPSFEQDAYLQILVSSEKDYLAALEPSYHQYIDPKQSRRMARIIKMSVAAAKKSLEQSGIEQAEAITVGTALGCLQDTEKFLAEIVETQEGLLSPTAFIQSTHNTIAGQIALSLACPHHNFTFVQRGFSFERALEDALLQFGEGCSNVLLGGVDELTPTLYQILLHLNCAGKADERYPLGGSSPQKPAWGEGAAFFVLSREATDTAIACIEGIHTFYQTASAAEIEQQARVFLESLALAPRDIDALMLGYNGCQADDAAYDGLRSSMFPDKPVFCFKHLCGEYFTASAFGLHLAAKILEKQEVLGSSLMAGAPLQGPVERLLLYNQSQGKYHSFILLSACQLSN